MRQHQPTHLCRCHVCHDLCVHKEGRPLAQEEVQRVRHVRPRHVFKIVDARRRHKRLEAEGPGLQHAPEHIVLVRVGGGDAAPEPHIDLGLGLCVCLMGW